jgi:hypothetical protein
VGLSLLLLVAVWPTRWRAAAAWTALALAGQACSLQLVWVGPNVRLQMFYGWSELLHSRRGFFLFTLLAQAVIVLWGARKLWRRGKLGWLPFLTVPQAAVFLFLAAFASTSIELGVARALAGGGGFGHLALVHLTKIVLGLTLFAVGGLNLALAAVAIPAHSWERAKLRWRQRKHGRVAWLCALWVVVVSSLLWRFALERMPHVPDEVGYLFQAKYLSAGHLYLPPPVDVQAFHVPFQMIVDHRWFSAQAAGASFLLALGFWAGIPWLVNPLLGAAAVLLGHRIVRKLFDDDLADATALLMAGSPWLLYLSASYMPHPFGLVCGLLGMLGVAHARENGSLFWAAVAGLGIGALEHARMYEAVLMALVAGVWWLAAGWKKLRISALAMTCLTGLLMTASFLAYNRALTGDPLYIPINKWTDDTYYVGANRIGFGRDVGNLGWSGLDALPGHGPVDAVMNANQNLYLINFDLFGWACGSLVFVFLLAAWGRFRGKWLMWGWALTIIAGLSLYWFSGGPDFGARYWYQLFLPVVVLTLLGAQALAARLRDPGLPAAVERVWAFIALATLLGVVNLLPWRALDKYHNYRGIRADLFALQRNYHFGHSLVLVRGPLWPDYASTVPFNPPTLLPDAPGPIFARELDAATTQRLRQYYSGRPIWILAGPSVTGRGFEVVEAPH